jgi:hypothetical protein
VISAPDQATYSPSENYDNVLWTYPEEGYTSNDQRVDSVSQAGDGTNYVKYRSYDVNLTGYQIDKVEVGAEWRLTVADDDFWTRISWDGGSSWSAYQQYADQFTESLVWKDFTSATAWTPDKLNNTNLRVQMKGFDKHEGGCYPNRTYFISYNETSDLWFLKNVEKGKPKDNVLVYDPESEEIKLSRIIDVYAHEGLWTILDIYSGELTVAVSVAESWTWIAHNKFTECHPVGYYLKEKGGKEIYGQMRDLKVGYYLSHLWHNPPYFRNESIALTEHFIKRFPITRIDSETVNCTVYNIRTEDAGCRVFLKYLSDEEMKELIEIGEKLGIGLEYMFDPPPISKESIYVDWLPVRITYSTIGEWTTVEVWYAEIQTRTWASVEKWFGELITRQWTFVETWYGTLIGRSWLQIEVWYGRLTQTVPWIAIVMLGFLVCCLPFFILLIYRRRRDNNG